MRSVRMVFTFPFVNYQYADAAVRSLKTVQVPVTLNTIVIQRAS